MKREDILDLIETTLTKYNSGHYSYDSTRHSKEILTVLEAAGMKPTGYHGVMASGKKYDPTTDQGRDVEYFHNWEPENE